MVVARRRRRREGKKEIKTIGFSKFPRETKDAAAAASSSTMRFVSNGAGGIRMCAALV